MKSMKWWTENYKKSKYPVLLLMLTCIVAFASGCSLFPTEAEEEEIPVIEPPQISKKPEMVVTRGDVEVTTKGTGQVYSRTEQYLYFVGNDDGNDNNTQRETFRIRKVYVQPGDRVSQGQVLAELDLKDLDLEIEESEQMLKIEEYNLIQMLREEPSTIEEQIAIEKAKAEFLKLKNAHEKLVRKLQNSQIIAPFDGTVYQLYYSEGAEVKAYDPVILLVDDQDLLIGLRISESDQQYLTVGQEVEITINRVNGTLMGKIERMPTGEKQNNNVWPPVPTDERKNLVLVSVEDLPEGVHRGMPANGTVVLQKVEDVVKIPLSFLHTYGDRNYVIVSDEQGRREVDVELGLRSAREVEIVAGIEAGVTIIGR